MSNNKFLKGSSGRQGDKVRSDCFVEAEIKKSGGRKISIKSKVDLMYGDSIKKLVDDALNFFDIKNIELKVEDYGALPFTLAARLECALKKSDESIVKEYLLPIRKENSSKTTKDRLRRSRLYLPGNEPKFFINAGLHKPDGLILDLEDSVAPSEKVSARYLVRNALRAVNFYGAERMVRINQLPMGLDDLKLVVPHGAQVLLIPKCETAHQIREIEAAVLEIKKEAGLTNDVYFMPIIESGLGVENSFAIATASKFVCSLSIGLEDYTADIGAQRTDEGKESFYMRTRIVNAAKAAGIQAIDSVYSDVGNMEGLRASVVEAKSLGFEGKGCIHPRQIREVHEALAPTTEEIEKAKKIAIAFEAAEAKGLGVVSLGSKMIDPPVVKRALKTINLALMNNLIPKNWKDEIIKN